VRLRNWSLPPPIDGHVGGCVKNCEPKSSNSRIDLSIALQSLNFVSFLKTYMVRSNVFRSLLTHPLLSDLSNRERRRTLLATGWTLNSSPFPPPYPLTLPTSLTHHSPFPPPPHYLVRSLLPPEPTHPTDSCSSPEPSPTPTPLHAHTYPFLFSTLPPSSTPPPPSRMRDLDLLFLAFHALFVCS